MKIKIVILLLILLKSSSAFSQDSPPKIRIAVLLGQDSVKISKKGEFKIFDIRANEIYSVNVESVIFKPTSEGIILDDTYNFSDIIQIKGEGSYIFANNRPYRGIIEIRNSQERLNIINELNIEEYLYGVMRMEISDLWPTEVIKAQAVAARTYALKNLGKHRKQGFDLTATDLDQVYGGVAAERESTNKAVDETYGEVLTYNGEIISSFYHSDSGGITEDVENVWGRYLPYLRSVPEPIIYVSPVSFWSYEILKDDLEKILKDKNLFSGKLIDLQVQKRSRSGRVIRLKIIHTNGEVEISGQRLRNYLGRTLLKSTLFEIERLREKEEIITKRYLSEDTLHLSDNSSKTGKELFITDGGFFYSNLESLYVVGYQRIADKFIMKGRGWGHGVGMSQWGAKALAEQGYNYIQILKHYYQGVELKKVY